VGRGRPFRRFGISKLVTVSLHAKFCFHLAYGWLVIGIQHHLLAQIILAIFDPNLPRIGGSRSAAVRTMEVRCLSPFVKIAYI
jgi:hypothetical protein